MVVKWCQDHFILLKLLRTLSVFCLCELELSIFTILENATEKLKNNNDKPITYQHNQLFLMKKATVFSQTNISKKSGIVFHFCKYLMPGLIDDTWILLSHSAFSP